MTELEVITRDILSLKRLLAVAWQALGSENISPLERIETRGQMQRAAADLRKALQDFQHEHARLRKIDAEAAEKRAPRHVKLRLIDCGDLTVAIGTQISQPAGANVPPDERFGNTSHCPPPSMAEFSPAVSVT